MPGTFLRAIAACVDSQRGHLVPWIPVGLAIGIGWYFACLTEPTVTVWILLSTALIFGCAAVLLGGWRWPLLWAVLLVGAGFALAGARTHAVAGPVLDWRYYGPIEGRILIIDRSGSDKPRLTLDRVVLDRVSPAQTPKRVRISLHGDQGFFDPIPGQKIIATGHLSAPQGPVEPGGFDFQRLAWFKGLGAVGYTRVPVLLLEPATGALPVQRLRRHISDYVQAALPGRAGAFAAAITTGDRSGMDTETLEALRASNLAHLLAISGLHMGLLTGFVFMALRFGMACIPALALNYPIKKFAAVGALIAAAGYLALSGGIVATQRAFIMAAVMFGAVLMDRRALTLRAVAVSAVLVLLMRPEALTGPGFQMSFSATIALVAVFRALRNRTPDWVPRLGRPALGLLISSFVAGAATAPIAAAHFNQIPHYGLIANMVSVPLMGSVVIPAAVLAACLAPFGLSWIGLQIMAPAILWILGVAHWVSGLGGALSRVPSPDWFVLPILCFGAIWIVLWQGRLRAAGLVPVAVALMIWSQVERPDLLIAESGGLVGVMTEEGRALSKPRGDGFAATSWLENDGTEPDQQVGAARPGFDGPRGQAWFDWTGGRGVHITGRDALARAQDLCTPGLLLVLNVDWQGDLNCDVIDLAHLSQTGALALYGPDGPIIATREATGKRMWNQQDWRDTPRRFAER